MAQGAVPEGKTGTLGGGAPEPWFPRLSRGHNASPYLTGKLRAFDDKPWDKCAEGCRARQGRSHSGTPRFGEQRAFHGPLAAGVHPQGLVPGLGYHSGGHRDGGYTEEPAPGVRALWVEPPSEQGAPGWGL